MSHLVRHAVAVLCGFFAPVSCAASDFVSKAEVSPHRARGLFQKLPFKVIAIGIAMAVSMPTMAGIQCGWQSYRPGTSFDGGKTVTYQTVWYFHCESTYDPRGGYSGDRGGGGSGGGEQSGNKGDQNDNDQQAGRIPCDDAAGDAVAGNPVVIGTGNKIEPESDFGTGGEMALHLNRTWNQIWDGNGLFGWHWISSFDYRLSFGTKSGFGPSGTCYARPSIPECTSTTSFTDIWAHRPDGRMIHFIKNTSDGIYYEDKPSPISKIVRQADGSLHLTFENNMVERYSKGGYPLWIQDEHGIRWTYSYGGLNNTQVQRVTHTNGRYVQFIWVDDELREVRDPAGTPYTFTYTAKKYDSNLNVLPGLHLIKTTTLPGTPSTAITYHYSGEAGEPSVGAYALTGKSFNGARYSWFNYDSARRAASTEHAGGVDRYTFAYTPGTNGALSVLVTNPLGKKTTYDFQNGKLMTVTGQASTHCPLTGRGNSYDANGYLDVVTDNNGNVTNFDYNAAGHLIKRVEASGKPEARTTTFVWDSVANRITSETVVGHSKTSYGYATDGRIASVTVTNLSANGVANQTHTTTYTYTKHPSGLLATSTVNGPLPGTGDAVVSTYDTYGNLTAIQNSLGHTTTYSNYNALGQAGRITGPNGDMTDFVYDARGRLTAEKRWINGVWQTTTYTYDGAGRLERIQWPGGMTHTYVYDAAWRLIREYEPEASGVYAQKRYTYNNASLVTRIDTERVTPPTTAPALTAPGTNSTGSYTVSWTAVSDTTSYRLEENLNGGAWTLIHNAAATSKTISGKNNGTYNYRVNACNAMGCGPLSATKSTVVTLPAVPVAPMLTGPPANSYTGTYTVSWGSVAGATSYQLEESANGGAWTLIYNSTGTSMSRTKPTGTYSYRVKACNANGCGVYSATRTINVEIESCPSCFLETPPEEELGATESEGGTL